MNKIYLQFSLKRDVKDILTKTCQGAYRNDGFFIKNRLAERNSPKVTENTTSLRLKIVLKDNVQHVINNIKFTDSKSCFIES